MTEQTRPPTPEKPVFIVEGQRRGAALFRFRRTHPHRDNCPRCGRNLSTTALVELAYVFTSCRCSKVEYGHLYEQLWHLRCLAGTEPAR